MNEIFLRIQFVKVKEWTLKLNYFQVGSLAALHLGKRGHRVSVYEYREGKKRDNYQN
jgi:hypothetical protein